MTSLVHDRLHSVKCATYSKEESADGERGGHEYTKEDAAELGHGHISF